jgi:dihydrofolate synthase/folylpolyglutamate synthase
MTAAILARHGLRAGTYTSPHLRRFRERIEVDGRPVAGPDFAAAVTRAAHAAEMVNRTADPEDQVTQFEALTAAAYYELARCGVEVAVVEAGLGGRYDATSVIPSKIQVVTGVDLEHTRWLGPTITAIAEEKLAVVRDHGTLVAGPLDSEARAVADRVVAERHARLIDAPTTPPAGAAEALNVRGAFQRRNFALAAAAAEAFLERPLEHDAVLEAARAVRVPGRLEVVAESPLTIYDGAHNPAGARALAEALPEVLEGRPLTGVFAILDDKEAAAMLEVLLPLCERAIFTSCANPRALPPATLEALAGKLEGPPAETVPEPRGAMERARALAGANGAVLATGSIYLIADLVREAGSARASTL